jgi:MraZ protein
VFRGRFDCKIDQKGRLILPASYREDLGKKKAEFVVTNSLSQKKKCLDLHLLSDWKKLEQKIAKMPSLKKEVQAYQRFYMSGGQVVGLDTQNRINLPQSLRSFAGIETQVMLVGMGQKIEIWSEPVWTSLQEQMADEFEDILAVVADLEGELDL